MTAFSSGQRIMVRMLAPCLRPRRVVSPRPTLEAIHRLDGGMDLGYSIAQLLRASPSIGGNRRVGSHGFGFVVEGLGTDIHHSVPSAPAKRERHCLHW